MNTQLILGVGVLGLSLLVDIIGTAIPYWWVYTGVNSSAKYGLFQMCATNYQTSACVSYTISTGWWKAVQAMMILSILALAAAVGLAVLFGFIMKDKKMLGLLSAVMGAAGAGLALLGVIIFGAKTSDAFQHGESGGLHAGFGLAIVAALMAIVGAILMVLARNSN